MPPTDPRFLDTSTYQMADEFEAWMEYKRFERGDTSMESEFESEMTEEEILSDLDALGDVPLSPSPAPDDWQPIDPDQLLKDLDQL